MKEKSMSDTRLYLGAMNDAIFVIDTPPAC
jgi:hypothetical protein